MKKFHPNLTSEVSYQNLKGTQKSLDENKIKINQGYVLIVPINIPEMQFHRCKRIKSIQNGKTKQILETARH